MAANLVSTGVVHAVLTEENYENWSVCIKNYLLAHDLWDTVRIEFKPKKNGVGFEIWKRKNAMALHTIQISCGPQILSMIRQIRYAKVAWDLLAKKAREHDIESSSGSKAYKEYVKYVVLLKAVERNDFNSVEDFLRNSPDAVGAVITYGGKTALHVAVTAGHVEIVKYLVELMSESQLELQEDGGYTALSAAAIIGIPEMAECIYNKNNKLIGIPTNEAGMIPVVLASYKGHVDMVEYLYAATPINELIGENKVRGATLISKCIVGKIFDVALHMLRCYPDLAFARDLEESSPVFRLSEMPSAFHSKRRLLFWQRPIYSCFQVTHREIWGIAGREIQEPNQGQTSRDIFKKVLGQLHWLLSSLLKLLGFEYIYKRKLMNVQAVELVRYIAEKIPDLSDPDRRSGLLREAIFEAVSHGIVEFITGIIGANPDLLWCTDEHTRDIFMCAVLYRQEKIFNLLYGIEARKDLLTSKVDLFQNNILHLAGMLSPSCQLDHISNAAFQMQRELQWFKEVKSVVNRACKESVNLDGKRPHDLFKENHENMMKEGQKWIMKNNATSCSVVAALMVTIMFSVAFTVPGGDSDETGLPIFLKTTLFKVFLVCDAISFFSSAASAMIFLGILQSCYAEKDFLKSFPTKMIAGQTTLFISFVTMMAAFSTALILMLRGQSLWPPILIIVFASYPIFQSLITQFPLLFEVILSTYGSIFNKNTKPWLTK